VCKIILFLFESLEDFEIDKVDFMGFGCVGAGVQALLYCYFGIVFHFGVSVEGGVAEI